MYLWTSFGGLAKEFLDVAWSHLSAAGMVLSAIFHLATAGTHINLPVLGLRDR